MIKLTFKNLLFTAAFVLFICFFSGRSLVFADDLPPGVIVGDDNGIKADDNGNYFIEHKDIKPGITFKKKITISNYSQEKEPFNLRLKMIGDETSGEINLLEVMTVTLMFEGKEIYKGNLAGKPNMENVKLPLNLGKFKVGDTKLLEATFNVSADLPTEKWKKRSKADFYWVFYATKEDNPIDSKPPEKPRPPNTKPSSPLLPQTGEEWFFMIIGGIMGVFVVMISLIIAKKRRNKLI